MRIRSPSILLAALSTLPAACSSSSSSAPPAAPPPAAALPPGLDTAGMDTTVAPGDDFYAYANGGWLKATPIPPDKASYGAGSILSDQTRQQTVALIQDAGKAGPGASAETRKVADFYAAFMDEAGIEARAWRRCSRRSMPSRRSPTAARWPAPSAAPSAPTSIR